MLGASLFKTMENPRKGDVSTRGETLAKELNLERSDLVTDRQPETFRSGLKSLLFSAHTQTAAKKDMENLVDEIQIVQG